MEGNCLGKMLQDGKEFQEAAGNTITVKMTVTVRTVTVLTEDQFLIIML